MDQQINLIYFTDVSIRVICIIVVIMFFASLIDKARYRSGVHPSGSSFISHIFTVVIIFFGFIYLNNAGMLSFINKVFQI